MVANPERIEPDRFGKLRHLTHLAPAHEALRLRKLQTYLAWPAIGHLHSWWTRSRIAVSSVKE
jgi:hypothetical protein